MAYLIKIKGSPRWYMRHIDTITGERIQRVTQYEHSKRADRAKAIMERDRLTREEGHAAKGREEKFNAWVQAHIDTHYTNKNSRERYQYAWNRLSEFLELRKLVHPGQIRPKHGEEYIAWRTRKEAEKKISVKHNTARLELKFLSYLLSVAALREIIPANPLISYKIGKHGSAIKPDLSDKEIMAVRRAFKAREPWMSVAFEICLTIGCRFSESSIPRERIDFRRREITLCDSKRKPHDPRKLFTIPISPDFANYLKKLPFADGLTVPVLTSVMNQRFNETMREACGATSHSCRVTFVTRCHRAGLSEWEAMRLVNHSRSIVHAIYSRIKPSDLRPALLRVPPLPPRLREKRAPISGKSSSRRKGNPASAGKRPGLSQAQLRAKSRRGSKGYPRS